MSQNQFQVPQELRQLAEENVERARQLYLQFMDGIEQTMSVWSAPRSDLIPPGFGDVRARATKFAKKNADAAFELAKDVAKAKDLQELLSLQTRYVQSQMQWYADQTQEFGELMARALTRSEQHPERTASTRAPATPQKPSPKPR
jgi:phasin